MAIAVKVSDRHGDRIAPCGVALGGLEGAVAVAEQNIHRPCEIGASPGIGRGEVRVAVAVKVPHRHGPGIVAYGVGKSSDKTEECSVLQALNERAKRVQAGTAARRSLAARVTACPACWR